MTSMEEEMTKEEEEMLLGSDGDDGDDSGGSESEGDMDDMDDAKEQELRQKAEAIKQQLVGNELYYDGHVNLISVLRELMELEEARKAREKMSKVYPLTPELWLDWIRDEQKICSTQEEREYIQKLFDIAVKDYISVQLWVEYVMFMLGGGDNNATRAVGDRALTAVGTHIAEGVLVWQVALLVEKQIYSGLQRPGSVPNEEEVKIQKKQLQRIQNLYRRVMRVPLLNADYQHLMEEAADFFDGEVDSHMKAEMEKTKQKLSDKINFEDKLLQTEDSTEKLQIYRSYISITKKSDNPVAVQSLYERAIVDHCLDAGLWEEYVKYVMQQFSGLDTVILPVCERAQRNCPWSATLCELHIEALQLLDSEEDKSSLMLKVKEALEKGLSSGQQSGSEAARMWMSYLVFLRRRIKWDENCEKQLEDLREAGQQAITMIDTTFGDIGDLESHIPRFLARIEAEFAKNMERARQIYDEVIMQRHDNFKNATLWLEFINLERSFGTEKHCRKLFRRALERVWDWVEEIGTAFHRFEQEVGTVYTMEEFNKRYKDRMTIVLRRRAEEAVKLEGLQESQPKGKKHKDKGKKQKKQDIQTQDPVFKTPYAVSKEKPDIQKSKAGYEGANNGHQAEPPPGFRYHNTPPPGHRDSLTPPPGSKETITPPPGFKETIPPPPGFKETITPPPGFKDDVSPPPGFSKAQKRRHEEDIEDEITVKRLKEAEQRGVRIKEDTDDDLNTVFISNLDFSVGEKEVCPIFTDCGEIKEFRLVKDFKCRSKGFGYLVFRSHAGAVKALKYDRTPIQGRPMFVSRYDPNGGQAEFKYSSDIEKNKLFVRGLPFHMSEEQVKNLFLPHGEIKTIRLVTYRNGHSKGLCYIEYHNADTAAKVIKEMDGKTVEDKEISVMISNPSEKKKPSWTSNRVDKLPEEQQPKTGPGDMKRKLVVNLMPRAVMRAKGPSPASPTPGSDEPVKPKSNDDFRKMFLK